MAGDSSRFVEFICSSLRRGSLLTEANVDLAFMCLELSRFPSYFVESTDCFLFSFSSTKNFPTFSNGDPTFGLSVFWIFAKDISGFWGYDYLLASLGYF